MCGIVGVVSAAEPMNGSLFDRMVDTLASRGPDGRGTQRLDNGRVLLGHRRLSIIDLSPAAHQPITNEDGTIWLTFNGEIYNYRSLRALLIERGHVFASHSDSEVIVHAYEEWGADCVRHFDGIFAFGLWDARSETLFLARDPLGVKPLYYAQYGTRFSFASQPKAILEDSSFPRSIDALGLADFFSFGYIPFDRSAYAGMSKLPAGHTAEFRAGRLTVSRYWSVEYRPTIGNRREAQQSLRDALFAAVESQLVSDVPVGCFLSGGIDSSVVVALASRKLEELRTFTVGFAEPESDERQYAARVARLFSTRHVEHFVDRPDLEQELSDLQEAFDEPFDPNGPLPFMHVARLARTNDTKVVLGGDGADELFVGYLRYDDFDTPQWLRPLPARLRTRLRQAGVLAPREMSGGDVDRYFQYEGCLTRDLQRRILADPFCDRNDGGHTALMRQFARRDVPAVVFAQLTDMHHYLVDHVLCKVDRASMAYGVETRVPFLSRELVELAFSIPLEIHYRKRERKSLLKEVAAQFLPADVVTSRKKGFSSPLHAWADADFQSWFHRHLHGGRLAELGVLRPDWSRGVEQLRATQPGVAARTQWLLVTAELWARRWLTA